MLRISLTEKPQNNSLDWQAPFTTSGLTRPHVLQIGKFYSPHHGGIETHLGSLCEELRTAVQLEVLVANDTFTTKSEMIEGVPVTRVGKMFTLSSAPVCPALCSYIKKSAADLVHIHLPHPTALLSYLASGRSGPLILSYHSDIIRQKVLGKLFEPFLKKALEQASAIIVASPNYLNTSRVLKDFKDRCQVIPYGIPVTPFESADAGEVAAIRQRYGPRLVLAVGRLVYYKGFEYLIRAMQEVAAHLVIVGNGPLEQKLLEEATRLQLEDKVTILNDVENVVPYYHAAELFVLPSIARSEAFGIVQLEAMACGKPVINTNLDSGVPFVSLDGETGLTVTPCDHQALSQAITKLLADPALRATYGQAGRKRVLTHFSLDSMTRQTLQLYDCALTKS